MIKKRGMNIFCLWFGYNSHFVGMSTYAITRNFCVVWTTKKYWAHFTSDIGPFLTPNSSKSIIKGNDSEEKIIVWNQY